MKFRRLFVVLYAIAATQLLSAEIVFGMGSSSDTPKAEKPMDPAFAAGKQFIDQKNWAGAVQSFSSVVKTDNQNADAYNYLGFANRQLGKMDDAFDAYGKALAINPNHKGANEYVGEAYLKIGNLLKAEAHLARLDDVCTFGCAEYTLLKRAVADYREKHS
ncbi:hypothetical protein A9Q83_14055 [Alphaproteobacteria bacterium 46_93_T64]|nr:hypothetical protein A9Q83_14055 [Alphaproteobacteria bacterium 46_93_T64]